MLDNPLVSIVIPTYNRTDHFLPIAIRSALKQTYSNVEVIVVNDCGQDISDVCQSFKDDRLRWYSNDKNSGLGATRNHGIQEAKGEYIHLLDDDDTLYRFSVLELTHFATSNEYKLVYGNCIRHHIQKGFDGKYMSVGRDMPYNITYKDNPDLLKCMNINPVDGFMIHKECFDKAGIFDTSLLIYEDWSLWLSMSKYYTLEHYNKPVAQYTWRTDGSTMSSSRDGFTTLLPQIYTYARTLPMLNRDRVIEEQNKSLMRFGLPPIEDVE